jgi:hypothetical protein
MTSVPGAGFVALLAITTVLLALPVLAGVSLLVGRVSGVRLEWSLLTVYVAGIVAGVLVVGLILITLTVYRRAPPPLTAPGGKRRE